MKTYQNTTLQTTTDYTGGYVYEGGAMSFFSSPEGRVVKNGSSYEYQYAVADHQGNTRVLFTSVSPSASVVTATFEGDSGDGSGLFSSVSGGDVESFGTANHTQGGSMVYQMNQTNPLGPARSIKVYPGDSVKVEVWAYYEAGSGYGTNAVALGTVIASALYAANGGVGESGSMTSGVNSALSGFGVGGNAGDQAPAAYLNYILFDQQFKVLDAGYTRVPTSARFAKQKVTVPARYITEAGYYFTYLSYEDESNNMVYFDDYQVRHVKSRLLQGNEYYPYGLQTASSWTRESNTGNNFLYNGGTELNQTTQVYDLYYRNYDPVLGRFGQVDPKASKYGAVSPYHFAGNNPAVFNDPMGDDYRNDDFVRFYSNTIVSGGPHDTNDPNRMYRGSDPYGTLRGRWLYARDRERVSLAREKEKEAKERSERMNQLAVIFNQAFHGTPESWRGSVGTFAVENGQITGASFIQIIEAKGESIMASASDFEPYMMTPVQLLNLNDASFTEFSHFLKYAYTRGGHQLSEILDFSGVVYSYGAWGEKWFTKKYNEGAYLEFNVSNENAIIDSVQPFYLYSFEKGWDEDETKMSTTPPRGSGANRGPYAIAIYSNSKSNERVATFYVYDLEMFQALKRYIRPD